MMLTCIGALQDVQLTRWLALKLNTCGIGSYVKERANTAKAPAVTVVNERTWRGQARRSAVVDAASFPAEPVLPEILCSIKSSPVRPPVWQASRNPAASTLRNHANLDARPDSYQMPVIIIDEIRSGPGL